MADGPNDTVIKPAIRLGRDVHAAMLRSASMPVSDYYGHNGYISRNDLAGLNLTTMPKVLIECGNMNNASDAALLVRPGVQKTIAAAIIRFLTAR